MTEAKARVLYDGKAKRTEYDEFEIGSEFTPAQLTLTLEQIDYFCQGNHDYHEWYSVDSPFGGRICPPLMNYRAARDLLSAKYNVRGLLYEYETENINPLKPNKKLRLTGKMTNKWIKRDKEFIEYRVTCVDEDGTEIFRTRRVHVLDALPRSVPRSATNEKTFNKL
ncbi:MAG: hypothetical protein A3G24_04740 [Betaproteobacteria bacterium RIFCSPLOWO2_12_FULL_62_13]|nr:MAG: hypothetical protein A3G24_04740 [Betaproteobacteria bacterium RIFCSPLOWO2_12_FULL_62_13]